jgi:SAM-dependent methyltransferase
VGFYRNQLLPRLQDKVMDREPTRAARSRVCATLRGDVVEVGFGTGLNARFYPSGVTRILAVEPSSLCLRIAQPRIERSPVPVERAGLTGERLDLGSDTCDAVLSTWTLCSIPDVASALKEMRRVLKPGSSLHFVEHGRAPDPVVERRQRRIEPINRRLAGGCHLTRDIPALIEQAGFVIEDLDRYYMTGEPRPFGFTFEGRAVKR